MPNKPKKSLFKRYDDAKHWGLFIPVGRKKWLTPWDAPADALGAPGYYRMHWIVTVKLFRAPSMGFTEIRVRIGFQYL